jgi:hypothetical protein
MTRNYLKWEQSQPPKHHVYHIHTPQNMANVRLDPMADFCINSVEFCVVLTDSWADTKLVNALHLRLCHTSGG